MTKAGWRDDRSARLQQLVVEYGLAGKTIETVFDLFDYDEGRDLLPKGRGFAYKFQSYNTSWQTVAFTSSRIRFSKMLDNNC